VTSIATRRPPRGQPPESVTPLIVSVGRRNRQPADPEVPAGKRSTC
jgi:hypothetical protein